MSRIGKNPVAVPQGVEVAVDGNTVRVKGKLGALERTLPSDVNVTLNDGQIVVQPANDDRRALSMWGLSRTLVANMVQGVSVGFTVKLEINGVGYRAAVDGKLLTLQLGFSHDIKYAVPADIDIKAEKPTALAISGIDKQRVGQIAAEIRSFRGPEPYKGKGVKYEGEVIVRKEGKKK
ncbi:50S ribosomal protein L6 [Tistrella bauzanensis]|uniref:Large ribosomal subunit protein uL6 n=2 Tax=Tistrella TaxID=171436 RepID=A0ABU9YMY4_9PROT|nr:50S ribosomal protein L6 [Tistrella bauzanensis]GGB41149.1 50S ribosomal protein L6 [Tistrella bauzanensis]